MGRSAKVDTSQSPTVEKNVFLAAQLWGARSRSLMGRPPLPFRIRFTLIMKSKNLLSIHCAEKELNAKNRRAGRE